MRAVIKKIRYLKPDEILCRSKALVIETIIGTGVAITLFDPQRNNGGICHFTSPDIDELDFPDSLSTGDLFDQLIQKLSRIGSKPEYLEASIIGGAAFPKLENALKIIAEENIKLAEELTQSYAITVTKRDVGGIKGRKLLFNSGSGTVISLKEPELTFTEWFPGLQSRMTGPIYPVFMN